MRIVEFSEEFFNQVRCIANLSLHEDTITDWSLRRITFEDPNYNSKYSLVALKNGEVTGFVLGVRRLKEPVEVVDAQRELAWVKLFAVREDCRGRGVATTLFNELENG